ncbi:MAG: hypothetical protein LBD66_02670 [Holosporales bacterium]|jgi:hypothetical protein|nr:hypothetical protein [Holosporales bacterium]
MKLWKLSFVLGLLFVYCGHSQGMQPLPEGVDQPRIRHPRVPFLREEDERLTQVVQNSSKKDWRIIAAFMPGRDQHQCWERWKNYLRPGLNPGPWTPEEDQLLREKVSELGTKWIQIEPFFLGRSQNNIKNRWNALKRRSKEKVDSKQNEVFVGEKPGDCNPFSPQDHGFSEKSSFEASTDYWEWFSGF